MLGKAIGASQTFMRGQMCCQEPYSLKQQNAGGPDVVRCPKLLRAPYHSKVQGFAL